MGGLTLGSAEVIAVIALIASVVSLIVSWQASRRSAKLTTYRSATDLTLDIDRIFVEHPELRRYFYNGAALDEPTDQGTRDRVDAIAELILDCFECIWDIRATYSRLDRGSCGRYVLDMLDSSPALTAMYRTRKEQQWYPALDDLNKLAESGRLDARPVRALMWLRRLWSASDPGRRSDTASPETVSVDGPAA